MNGTDIRKQIDYNNDKIESLMHNSFFTLNHEINELLEKNKELQKQCSHVFENGICIYCDCAEDKK